MTTMSFLHLYRNHNNNNNTIVKKAKRGARFEDLSDDLLMHVFNYCDLVDMSRCALVNHRFRELIEDMEDTRVEPIRCTKKARIFVCDRRRAILEGMSNFTAVRLPRYNENGERIQPKRNKNRTTSTGTTSTDESAEEKCVPVPTTSPFICDQYADKNLSSWAYQFDFGDWIAKYEVGEVFLRNFCSFFEREQSDMELNFKGRTPSPPSIEEPRSYDKLPSTQSKNEQAITHLAEKDLEILKQMSAGRVERLAERMKNLRGVHCIFKDSCCYANRPPAMMFWFLSMMRTQFSRITFDRCQASVPVEAHEVLNLANIHRLVVVQPESKPAMVVRIRVLLDWLRLAEPLRRKISVHLTGCREITPKALAAFVSTWRAKETPALFKQISLDGNSYKYNDFVYELELLQTDAEKEPPISPFSRNYREENIHAIVLDRVIEIHHSRETRLMLRFKYCKITRRMVLTCEEDHYMRIQVLSPVSTLSRLSLGSGRSINASASELSEIRSVPSLFELGNRSYPPSSTTDKRMNRSESQATMRIAPTPCREGSFLSPPSFVNKLMKLLSSSSSS